MLYQILKIISLAGLAIILGFAVSLTRSSTIKSPEAETTKIKSDTEQTAGLVNAEIPLALEAKAACVFDFSENKFLFRINEGSQLPLASLNKLMTALVAKENMPQTQYVEITKDSLLQEGDVGLKLGETWLLSDLIKIMLISSSNDAAFAITSSLSLKDEIRSDEMEFVNLMNQKAKVLGLDRTYFLNSTGLDVSQRVAGGYSSCEDLTNLARYILEEYSDLLETTTRDAFSLEDRIFKNTNELLPKLPFLIAGKTGFSDLAGGNLVVIVDKEPYHPIVIVVLGSSEKGRFQDAEMLYNKYVK